MNLKERLLQARLIAPFSGCWIWTKSVDAKGYGQIRLGTDPKTLSRVHRVAYQTFVGPSGDLCVLHKCDNPRCFNPEHLFLGTHKDNMEDCMLKGRANGGPRKLTFETVREIRRLSMQATQQELSALYGVGQSTISRVINGETWRRSQRK